ncbi:MAG: DUF2207 domain-containing protein [Candidatus Melainabacteria bacterium]|nr:DUF2207 domain-containing protein [Candidatus Melainabacteria bacterium]
MKNLPLFIALSGLVLGLSVPAAFAEAVDSFVCEGRLRKDGVMAVKESIEVDLDSSHRSSFYRIIPAENASIKLGEVTDGRGHAVGHATTDHGGSVSVRLDKHTHGRSGYYRYQVTYEARGVCREEKGHPVMRWNVVGHDWPMKVKRAEFVFYPPSGVSIPEGGFRAYKTEEEGRVPASARALADHYLATASNLGPGESLIVEAELPPGTVAGASLLDQARWLLSDWYLLLAVPLLAMAGLWAFRAIRSQIGGGEDEQDIWEPPAGLRPVEMGTLLDQSCDVSDMSVTLVNLAVRGFYTIREIPASGYFALSERDYELKKLAPPTDDPLKDYELLYIDALFGNGLTAYLSNLQGGFRQFLPKIKKQIYRSLVREGFLVKDPEMDRTIFGTLGFLLMASGICVLFTADTSDLKGLALGLVIAGVVVAVSPRFFPLRTKKGRKAVNQIQDFADTLKTARGDEIVEKMKKDPFIFHRLLPYAIVLGVFEKWAAACEEHVPDMSPDWFQFHDGRLAEGFSARDFARDVWIATKLAGLTFTAPPPRQYSDHTVAKFGRRPEQEHDDEN